MDKEIDGFIKEKGIGLTSNQREQVKKIINMMAGNQPGGIITNYQ